MSASVKKMFDSISDYYDIMNHLLTAGRDIRWRKRAVKLVTSTKTTRVLDLCGGTGDFSQEFSKNNPVSLQLIGDFSFNMLTYAQKKNKVRTIQLDALNLPLKKNTFDLVMNGFGMRNLDCLDQGLKEVERVLEVDGDFITLEFFKPSRCIPKVFYKYLAPVVLPLPSLIFRKDAPAYKYLVRSIHAFVTVEEYSKRCEDAGFVIKNIIPCDGGIAHIVHVQKGEKSE